MANTLMFEVGIKSAQEQLDKIKQEFTKANGELSKLLNIKVSIDGVDAVTRALSQIGDTSALRSLRSEIAALNREFAVLSKGAGGSGDIAGRGIAADIEKTTQSIERYTTKIRELTEERSRLVGGTRHSSYQTFTDEILRYQQSLEGARSKLAQLNEQKNQPVAENTLKKSTQDAKAFETAIGRIEAAISGLKSGMSVNLSGDFAAWAKEVQAVTASVRELVEQLQKMNTAATTSSNVSNEALLAQAKTVDDLRTKYNKMLHDGLAIPKSAASYTAIEELPKVEKRLEAEQAKFNEMLIRGASVAGSYAEAIQQLGQKYNLTAEQAQKLASIIANGNLERGNIQRGLGVGYQKAGDIVDTINALQKLKQEENKPAPQNSIFDPQQFKTLQEAIDAVIREINRLKEAFVGIGEIKGMTQLTESMNALFHNVSTFKDVFSTLSAAVNLTPTSEYVKKLQTDFEAAQAKVQELTEKLTALAAAQNQVAETAAKTGKSEKQIGDSQSALFNRYNKLLADIQNIKREIVEIQRSSGGGGPFGEKLGDYFSALNKIRNSVREITSAPSVADAIQRGMSSEMLAKLNSAFAALKTNFKEVISDAKDFNKATDKGSSQAESRIRKLGMAFNELKNYMKANGGSEEMRKLQAEIQGAIQKMRQLMNAGNFAGAVNVYERMAGSLRQAATATKEFENSQHSLSSTISHTNGNLQGQSQILSDLKSMATQYLSVWGAQSFINNIIELGGQLEQQRLSIGAILQDTAQANHLFSQIKDLAIKSPFGVQQLDAMTKQLSAYGFQYSELYDWTKRLADISAATGTSVDRLALALGHVRAEGALSGYTLRQFSMGNIPLLQKLSENLGKTKQEIRKMTRNKEIGYEDVLNVLKQLTDEGGMFFEAQETMSQALNAKFKNLRDSFQIMYSEMAEGAPGDFLKGLATTLTDLSRQWQILMPMVGAAGAMWAMNKASAALVNVELAKMATLTNANTLASSKYSVAQLRQIANWEKMPHAMVRARLALQGFRTSLLSLGKMVFSWPTAIFAAIEALTYMWAKQSRESEKAKEMTEALTNTALESQKNLSKQLSNIDPYEKGMSDSAMKTGIDSMTESIKNYGVNAQAVLETVFGKDAEGRVMSLAEKYQYLREELEKTEKVYKEMQRTSGGIEFGVEFTDGGWLDDDVQTDLTKYAEAVKEYENAFISMTANYSTAVNNALEQVRKASPEFKRIADGLSSDAERVKWLYENQGEYGGLYNMFKGALHREDPNAGGGVLGAQLGDNLRSAEQEAMKELDQFLKGTEEWFKKFGYDFTENGKNLSEVQVGNLLRQSKEWLEKHPEWQNIYDVIWDKLNKRWGLPIVPDVTEIEEELPQWLEDLQKELDKTGIKLTANMSMEQIVDEMKKAYDKAQTTINKLGPIAMQAQIDIKGLTDENIEKYRFLNPELYETLKDIKKAQDSQNQVNTVGQKRGLNFKGMKKDGSHKQEKEKKDQESAKAVREQVRVIKEAADAFQYWRDKVGDKGAWEHVQSEFGDVLKKIGITADNIEDVRGHLKKIPQMKEYKAITDKKVKTEIDKEIAKENDQFIRKDFERDTERFLSKTQLQLDNLTRSWETFNAVREATGNVRLAVELSGADYVNGETQNLADSIKKKIQRDFEKAGSVGIPFDINLSDREIKESIEKVMPAASEDQLKGLIEEYKKWRDLQRDVLKRDINTFAKLVGSAKDYNSQIKKINDNLKQQIEANNRLVNIGVLSSEEAMRANSMATVQAEDEKWKLSFTYSQLMNNSLALTRSEVENGITKAVDMLNQKMKAGLITAQEFAEEMAKIQNVRSEWTNSPISGAKNSFTAGLFGGFEGRRSYLQAQMKQTAEAMARELQKLSGGSGTFDAVAYDRLYKKYQGDEGKLKRLDSFKSLTDKFQALSKTLEPVIDLFNKLGMSEVGQVLGIGQNALQSAASTGMAAATVFGQAAGPWGMAAGAAISVVGGLFSMMDSALQEEIDASKARQKEMETLTKNLEKALERTLGGVYRTEASAEDRRKLEEYRTRYWGNSAMGEMMSRMFGGNGLSKEAKEFYKNVDDAFKKALDTNSYYDTQRAFLYAQKYELEKQMRAEQDKKSSDDNAIADYKQQLAELEDQIKYFALDMAKALYDIDIQSWASDLTDAIVEAWENGEDAAEAYTNKVKDLMKDLTKNILAKKVMEKAFENAGIDKLIADMMDRTSGKLDYTLIPELSKALAQAGQDSTDIITRVLDELERMGYIEKGEGSGSGSVTSGIKSITENTADLLASYLNATRASTANIENLSAQYFPLFYQAITSNGYNLRNIENHTAAIMRSNETIAEKITSLDDDIHGLRTNVWKMPVS